METMKIKNRWLGVLGEDQWRRAKDNGGALRKKPGPLMECSAVNDDENLFSLHCFMMEEQLG